jgi:hypothetical protein
MVTFARNIHLNTETTWTKKKSKSSHRDRWRDEWKRTLWWEIVFYDLYESLVPAPFWSNLHLCRFIADILGQEPQISLSQNSPNLPACAVFSPPSNSEGEKAGSDNDSHTVDQELVMQDAAPIPRPNRLTDEEAYFGARYQCAYH